MSWIALFSAFWLGVLTAISPCPLATNIAAISFIGKSTGQTKTVIISGFLYSIGRIFTYIGLGVLITAGLFSRSEISLFLQKHMNELLGPIMILLGLILLGWIGAGASLMINSSKLQDKAKTGGLLWAFPIGVIFALSFCPVSAGLFFGGLLPMAIKENSILLVPLFYGIGTAIPVVIFAFIIAFSSAYVGKAFNKINIIDLWIRRIAGTAFILVGIYYSLTHIWS
ncbi:MAG: sulfite exporter TauE/SafE family protein [Candidatus Marinimicrobia bacterium]|nr:sulfite exporter TauE/SafE family protein [Candidatus Neomarinimicrobiota bacterium]